MNSPNIDLNMNIDPRLPVKMDLGIGCIGSGFIMADIQLVSYRDVGFQPLALATREEDYAQAVDVARRHGIPSVYRTWQELLKDPKVEILDIAFPPHLQLEIVKEAVKESSHIKGILAQKPLAVNLAESKEIVRLCQDAGIVLSVNQNMRYDQSMRALKNILDKGYLGEPVLATIEMRAIPHWQKFLEDYDRLTLLNMSIHHLDIFRYLFGDPEKVQVCVRQDPRTQFEHRDGISLYTLKYENGMIASSVDDVWAWPGEGTEKDNYIKWRVEGTGGIAKGTIGWPDYPTPTPSTIEFTTSRQPGYWFRPQWGKVWFPDAFAGTMAQLMCAVEDGVEPEISGRDNLKTMALIEACYMAVDLERTIKLNEINL